MIIIITTRFKRKAQHCAAYSEYLNLWVIRYMCTWTSGSYTSMRVPPEYLPVLSPPADWIQEHYLCTPYISNVCHHRFLVQIFDSFKGILNLEMRFVCVRVIKFWFEWQKTFTEIIFCKLSWEDAMRFIILSNYM